jgi:hypothetical protein
MAMTDELDDALLVEEILDEVLEDLEGFDFLKSTEVCPVRTVEKPEEGKYPVIVTKDFGDGCKRWHWGRMKSGKIIIAIMGPWCEEGSVREVTFEEYKHGNTLVEGSKRIECMGRTDEGYIWHKITGELELTREREDEVLVIKRKVEKDRYMINGFRDKEVPNEWLIEGVVEVEKSNGTSYTVRTVEPLYRIQGCRWFQAGIKQIESGENVIQLDYGFEGEEKSACDSWITRQVNEEEPGEIDLSARN